VTLTDLGVLYGIGGVASAALVRRFTGKPKRESATSLLLSLLLWPLWLPIALASRKPSSLVGPRLSSDTEVALLEAHAAVRGTPLEPLLPRQALDRILSELARAGERHAELSELLARRHFDPKLAEARVARLTRDGAPARTLSSARLHLDNVERLAALRARDQRTFEELAELVLALRAQLVLAKFSESSASDVQGIVSEVWARIDVLGTTLEPASAGAYMAGPAAFSDLAESQAE
jgi:hypothetical protein